MKPNKNIVLFLIVVTSILVIANALNAQVRPVLFFSDLTSGPKTGWEGSTTKGAAVTVWGKNFGATRGSNYITVNGAQLTSASDYAEWGITGTANGIPRGLQRITFWLKSTMSDGAGTISVTVGGITSNTLPFTIRTGNIYFIAISDGNNSYNGQYSTRTGHSGSDGPWRDIYKAAKVNTSTVNPGDTFYVRGGTYTTLDPFSNVTTYLNLSTTGGQGTSGSPYALVGYPTEWPLINGANGVLPHNNWAQQIMYWGFAKLKFTGGGGVMETPGQYIRVIGNWFLNNNTEIWSGVLWVDCAQYVYIYGNYFYHNGNDAYMHNIYIKSQPDMAGGASNPQNQSHHIYVGWNEFDTWTANLNASEASRGGCIEVQQSSDMGGYHTHDVHIFSNYFHDGDSQWFYGGGYSVFIYNNIISNITSPDDATRNGMRLDTWDANSAVYNNTFYHIAPSTAPMISLLNASGSGDLRWKNNIFYAYSGQTYVYVDSGINFVSDYDLFYGNGVPTGTYITHAVGGNPLFIVDGTDFHLQASSPAINAGTSSVNTLLTSDYNGISRPQGLGWDIGAYEYYTNDTTRPSPPVPPTVEK